MALFDILKLEDIIESEINDIRDSNNLTKSIENFNPEIVFHLAAQPLVRDSYDDPKKTYETKSYASLPLFVCAFTCTYLCIDAAKGDQ